MTEESAPIAAPITPEHLRLLAKHLRGPAEVYRADLLNAASVISSQSTELAKLRAAMEPYHARLKWNFASGCYMNEIEAKDLLVLNELMPATEPVSPSVHRAALKGAL